MKGKAGPMNDVLNKATIRAHEGERLRVYRDTKGHATVGVGCNLDAPAAKLLCSSVGVDYDALLEGRVDLTPQQMEQMFDLQYLKVRSQARVTFPEMDAMPDQAAAVICDMVFNMGYGDFLLFRKFIAAMQAGRWAVAIEEMESSSWARQVPKRVASDVKLMEQIGADPILKG